MVSHVVVLDGAMDVTWSCNRIWDVAKAVTWSCSRIWDVPRNVKRHDRSVAMAAREKCEGME